MNTINLEELGITKEQIIERVIDRCAERLLCSHCHTVDEDGNDFEWAQDSPLAKQMEGIFKARVDLALAEIAERHILPNVTNYIENITLQTTNKWGEAKGERLTFLEYLTQRAEAYMTEQVDYAGKSKAENSGYGWSGTQTRITHLVHQHLHYSIDAAMKDALKNGLSGIVKGIEETAKIKLAEAARTLKVSTEIG